MGMGMTECLGQKKKKQSFGASKSGLWRKKILLVSFHALAEQSEVAKLGLI